MIPLCVHDRKLLDTEKVVFSALLDDTVEVSYSLGFRIQDLPEIMNLPDTTLTYVIFLRSLEEDSHCVVFLGLDF